MSGLRLGILGSTRGTDMLAIMAAIEQHQLSATVACVLSNQASALILERAKAKGVPALFVNPTGLNRTQYDQTLSEILHQHQVDLVVLIGYMRILSADFVNAWHDQIINVHPSLLPDFAGGMNHDVHAAVIQSGQMETGCTVHRVTEAVDQGEILLQKRCAVLPNDTVESLKNRVQHLEGQALIEVIAAYCAT